MNKTTKNTPVKHTPGPWIPKKRLANFDQSFLGFAVLSGSHPVCQITMGGKEHLEKDEANARLIAAAPELLEALEETLEGAIPHKRDFLMTAYAKRKAESAIAKATGTVLTPETNLPASV